MRLVPPAGELFTVPSKSATSYEVVLLSLIPARLRLLLLEHPTRALDLGASRQVWQHLLERSREGTAILFSSADLDEIFAYSHRLLVFYNRRLVADLPARATNIEAVDRHSPVVYLSLVLIPLLWWWVFRTRPGLELRAVGEKPQAAFARGIRVHHLRIVYTLVGGALVGLAGGAFSLAVKPGWGRPQGAEGAGWIALALVIFGGWHPIRAALGAYLFAALQVLGITLQESFPGLPAPLFQVSPFPVMILTLLLVNMGRTGWVQDLAFRYPGLRRWLSRWQATAPAALGRDFQPEKEG